MKRNIDFFKKILYNIYRKIKEREKNMTKEDILKRLRAGESADDIALEITDLLNEALQMKEKEDEAKRKAEEERAWHVRDAEILADAMNTYFNKYCGCKDNIKAEHIIDSEKEIAAIFNVGDKIKTTVIKNPKAEEIAKIFNDFFNEFGI